jgi:HAD superfamily hydrolase (TIGR01509 family)
LIRAILFDYGDTLVVARKQGEEIMTLGLKESFEAFKRTGLDIGYAKFVEHDRNVFGNYAKLEKAQKRDIPDQIKYDELARLVLARLAAAKRKRIATEANAAFWGVVAENYVLRRGSKSSLIQLKKMGLRMGVVSNHHNAGALRAHLKTLGIFSYFTDVTASSELRYRKPDARIFRRSAGLLGVRPNEAVFVGDSPAYDIAGASGVGMLTVMVVNSLTEAGPKGASSVEPDYTIRDLGEVPEIVERLNRSVL